MCEQHLDFLAPLLRGGVKRRCGALVRKFPDFLEPLAGDRARVDLWAALLLGRENAANHFACTVTGRSFQLVRLKY